jgi:hypothetical protein
MGLGSSTSKPAELGPDTISIPPWASKLKPSSPVVFFDVAANGTSIGRIEMTLADTIVPKTVDNFRSFCTGEKGTQINSYYVNANILINN